MKRMRGDKLELVMEAGTGAVTGVDVNPLIGLSMSYDGGVSFGNERYQFAGKIGVREARARWRRFGMGRRPVAKIFTTSTQKVVWLGANVEGEILST
jgi:hypothetical protein